MGFEQLQKQLAWFTGAGVDRFNFSVLSGAMAMLNHDLAREAAGVLKAAGWAWARGLLGENVYLRPAAGSAWPIVFLDDLPPAKALALAGKYSALVVETSRTNCQAWIRVTRSLATEERKEVQIALAGMAGADPASTSGDHFGRAAGFHNKKTGRGNFLVDVLAATGGEALDPAPYLLPHAAPHSLPQGGRVPYTPTTSTNVGGESEKEFAFACHRLRAGWSPARVIEAVADHALARGKRRTQAQAQQYAVRTVKKAQAALR